MIKIRLARGGRVHAPIYTIVAADERAPRDGSFLQKLGQYVPSNNEKPLVSVDVEAVSKWVSKGAQMTDTVKTLFKKNNIKLN